MNKYIIISLICFGFSSCGLLKKNYLVFENLTTETNVKNKVNETNLDPNWLSLNSKITIEKETQKTGINANIRVKKDSVIWVSLKAPLGIEILRTMITPDSIYFMSRMDKTFFVKPVSHLKEFVKTDVNFFQFQEVLFSSPEIKNNNLILSFNEEGRYVLTSNQAIYTVSNFFRVEQMKRIESEERNLTINFKNYTFFDEVKSYFPTKLFIEVESDEKFTAEIEYTRVVFNKKSSLSFKIPKSYVKVY